MNTHPLPTPVTIQSLLQEATQKFRLHRLDAELIIAHVLKKNRSWLYTWPEKSVDAAGCEQARQWMQRRAEGEPLAYLTGEKEFYGLKLKVTRDTLIPRPETELMINTLLELQQTHPIRRVLDMGTGSGAIALAVAATRPDWQVMATDSSSEALAVAQANAQGLGLEVTFAHGQWFDALGAETAPFSAILSNPPYIENNDPHLLTLRHEPRRALVAGNNGLADLFHLIEKAPAHLENGGWLLLEHGYNQSAAVRAHMVQNGYQNIQTVRDLAGLDRVTLGRQLIIA